MTEDEAIAEAARDGSNVEVMSLRGESSETYATPAGHLQVVEHLRPVRARVDGQWKPVDTDLEARSDGSVGPKVTSVAMGFSGGGGTQPLITLRQAGRTLSLKWPGALPVPVLDGDTATYPDVLPDVDLQVRADVDGVSEVLVVKSAQAAANPQLAEVHLAVGSDGLSVGETPDGGLRAVDRGAGGTVFEAPQPLMWDSSTAAGEPSPATGARTAVAPAAAPADGPGDSGRVAPVDLSVAPGGGELMLTPDQELLGTAQYPVYIDPQFSSPKASSWTMVSRYWASSPQWKFNGDSDAGVGYCAGDSRCAPEDLKRLLYQVPTSAFAGKSILSAEFVAHETHSYSCDARNVEVWRTKGISSSTTWNSQLASGFWIDKLQTVNTAHGYTGCAAGDIEFSVLRAVQQASANSWSSTTFGLKATNESDAYSWKRFSDDAFLRVEYNRPPRQIAMSQLTMDPGGSCVSASNPKRVRILPKLIANNVTDPDGDTVRVQFGASWDTGDGKGNVMRWSTAFQPAKASGSDFSVTMPSSTPKNKMIGWYARSYDGAQYSPWSYDGSAVTCATIYDTSVPDGPGVVSGQYPRSDPENPNDPWTDGVGRYGTFTVDSAATDVVKYWYGINGDPTSAHTVTTTAGGAVNIKMMPTKSGVNFVTAQAFDAAGNGSQISTYQFRVRAGQPDRLSLDLNEPAGSTAVSGSGGAWNADLHGGAATVADESGGSDRRLHLNGTDGYAATDSPVTNTGKSFSVSVWAKLPATEPALPVTALSESGQYTSGYQLYYSPANHGWVFARFTSDNSAGQGFVTAAQPACPAGDTSCRTGRLGTWTHVAGVFDNTAGALRLYINGTLAATTPYTSPWDARGRTLIGASAQNGVLSGFFSGDLNDAELYDYQLTDAEVTLLAGHQAITTVGRPAKLIWSFDDADNATTVVGRAQPVTAALHGGPVLGGDGVDKTALNFDGADDYAQNSQPILDTFQSFSVSFWARAANEDRTAVAVHQAGVANRGFEIYHNPTGWVFQRATSDTADSPLARAQQQACPAGQPTCAAAHLGQWTHVVSVYDIDTADMHLYVDGVQVATAPFTTPWLATGVLTLGASNYPSGMSNRFKGDLDDFQLYDRALSTDEITNLFKQNPVVKGRWQFESASGTPATSPDASPGNRPATLYNGAKIDTGWVDSNALNLDGVDDYAATGSVPIDTSHSFTVTAWAQMPYDDGTSGDPPQPLALISQEGNVNSAFTIQYVPAAGPTAPGHWQIKMPNVDSTDPQLLTNLTADNALSDTGAGSWTPVALTYDAFAGQMRLYVNGELQQSVCPDSDGDGTSDDPSCTDTVSWASNAIGFNATKSLQIGRAKTGGTWGEYWSGSIDDVWAFQGVLTQAQVQQLALGLSGKPTTVPSGS
ncbi:LamG domain-containing protein [Streptomyces sp. NBC_01476]|uniref:LamG-like jellyroll fold domain-containing protein n=1 Tax=Streptomyces sp. NBC_01476 TaxID=2903881 RepID=UPI002E3315D6|nr:LamG-like jellyroll fold domain-containing protein [Streptomyces sp. NBC_01476]